MMPRRTLYILCGGQSRRMGSDKALLSIQGKSLLDYWIDKASPYFQEVVLLSGSNRYETSNRQLRDEIEDAGPLAGLLTAMNDQAGRSENFAMVAIDLPNLKNTTLQKLANAMPAQNRPLIASCGNTMQPLVGIYPCIIKDDLKSYLNRDERAVMKFMKEINPEYFSVSKDELINTNDPDSWNQFIKELPSPKT